MTGKEVEPFPLITPSKGGSSCPVDTSLKVAVPAITLLLREPAKVNVLVTVVTAGEDDVLVD